ncbi:multicomponent Na+:H+ antiporter subunit A [Mumia flava]|uniref:Multicomponent Na+:H+ antiporter subunit A n=1 Tax=Mumia flava TaxID=1348852 RepID=A0A0B2BTI9_9ACTN|nr:Na+/H+ antiporter subunit A [Mumia flava]PJJ57213.1 multicomponent Na+:H+ antiporter subunit A [Mumia flava]
MLALLLVHLVAAALAPALVAWIGRRAFLVLALAPAASFAWLLTQAGALTGADAGRITETYAWAPSLGLSVALRLDTLTWTMALLVTGVGALVLAYCRWYFRSDDADVARFAGTFVAFAGSMLGLVMARDLLLLYVFWEATTVFSYLLVGHNPERAANRRAAMTALIVTTFGGLAMLGGIILVGQHTGSYAVDTVMEQAGTSTLVSVAIALVLVGAVTKSALVPFHFWLPGAMAAPTPVSAYLHAAAMVKAGVLLVAMLAPAFTDLELWRPTLLVLGTLTMIVGGLRALAQHDVKLLLAYGTVSQLGFLVAVVGLGTRAAALAGLAMVVAHALFKAALFLVVGIVDHSAGTRDLRRLSGLRRQMPWLFGFTVLAAASMAGLPPMLGFVAKESVYGAFVDVVRTGDGTQIGPAFGSVVLAGLVVGSLLTMAYSLRLVWGIFADKPGVDPVRPEPAAVGFVASPAILAVLSLALGFTGSALTDAFAGYDHLFPPGEHHAELALWHGLGPPLWLSVVAVVGGIGLFAWMQRRSAALAAPSWMPSAERAYGATMRGTDRLAVEVTGLTQRGSLPFTLGTVLIVTLLVPGTAVATNPDWAVDVRGADSAAQAATAAVMALAAVLAVRSRRRLKAVLLAGVSGYCTALLFLLHGAPDLALTQVLVETVTVVVFVLVIRRMAPYFSDRPLTRARWVRVAIGAACGVLASLVALIAAGARTGESVSAEFADAAVEYGGGHNIVNVTLVDIRAWDTMGEISVLVVAATGVASLIFLITGRGGAQSPRTSLADADAGSGRWLRAGRTQTRAERSIVFEIVTRLLFHTIIVFSLWLLFAGHNGPGGGFAGGLMAGLALTVRYLAGGRYELDDAAPIDAGQLLGIGLVTAALTALAPLAFGGQVLQSAIVDVDVPLLGHVHLVTSLFFDVGVYLVVVGMVLDLLRSLGGGIDAARERGEDADPSELVGGEVP